MTNLERILIKYILTTASVITDFEKALLKYVFEEEACENCSFHKKLGGGGSGGSVTNVYTNNPNTIGGGGGGTIPKQSYKDDVTAQ